MTSTNGQDVAASGQEITITITDNNYVQTVNGQVVERGTFKIDESKKPMTMDLSITEGDNAGQTQIGVVEITGKTMTGKMSIPAWNDTPDGLRGGRGFLHVRDGQEVRRGHRGRRSARSSTFVAASATIVSQ